MSSEKLLRSKLIVPQVKNTVRRDNLNILMSEIPRKKLTTVVAGAGYGKTTCIAQAIGSLSLPAVWYRFDSYDTDFTMFINYLIVGVQAHYSEFGLETLHRIKVSQTLFKEEEAIVTVFLNELEQWVKTKMILVLDDFHVVQQNPEIKATLQFLIEFLPQTIHLIIIGRTQIQLPLSRLRSAGEVLDITQSDLVFTNSEIEQLFREQFAITITNDDIDLLHQQSEGWIAGLILYYHSLRNRKTNQPGAVRHITKGTREYIFEYLEENVFGYLNDDVTDFLLKSSILSELTADFCNQLLVSDNAETILIYLAKNYLFTYSIDDEVEVYQFHHLFQEFLQEKLRQSVQPAVLKSLHGKAARLYELSANYEPALRHYLEANCLEEACRLLGKMGRSELLKKERLTTIKKLINKKSAQLNQKEPWIQFIYARIKELSGNPQDAIRQYEQAHKQFTGTDDRKGMNMCLKSLGYNYYIIGDFERAANVLADLLSRMEKQVVQQIDTLGYLVAIHARLGNSERSDKYYHEACSLLPASRNKLLSAWLGYQYGIRCLVTGDFDTAVAAGRKSISAASAAKQYYFLAAGHHLTSLSLFFKGKYRESLSYADDGLELIEEKGVVDSSQAWLLLDRCLSLTALGNLQEALSSGRNSLHVFQEYKCLWGIGWSHYALQLVYKQSGQLHQARDSIQSGLDTIQGLNLPLEQGMLNISLADLYQERGQIEGVDTLLQASDNTLTGFTFFQSQLFLLLSRYHWAGERKPLALDFLKRGLELCRQNGYGIWATTTRHWIVPLLIELYSRGTMKDYILSLLKTTSHHSLLKIRLLEKSKSPAIKNAALRIRQEIQEVPPPALKVHCFGEFRLFRGDEAVPASRWTSKISQMVFKYLLYYRSRGYVPKETLIELLWPEQSPKKSTNNLHVALSALRKTLEPELTRNSTSSYLLREGNSYSINTGKDGFVDFISFEQEIVAAKRESEPTVALGYYLNAERLYTGDFLIEDRFTDWCATAGKKFKTRYLEVLSHIIACYRAEENIEECARYIKKYLNAENTAENMYRLLMECHSLLGNRVGLIRTYKECKEAIATELDCNVSEETATLFKRLNSPR